MQLRYYIFFTCLQLSGALVAQDVVPLITNGNEWRFNNGQEFPGATGALTLDEETARDGKPSLKLEGDFTGGGGYVEAGRDIPDVDIRNLSLWVKNPNSDHFTMRLNDASGQTHQINLKTEQSTDWQLIDLPLERFFARRGQADAVTSIAKYESWGGAKDGNWHGPAKAIYLLLGNEGANKVRTLWLNDVTITPPLQPVSEMKSLISIGDHAEWGFSNGAEFKGAEGSLTEVGGGQLKLSGDFTGGGAYVAAIRNLEDLQATKAPLIKMRVKSANAKAISVQLVDGSGQTHQMKGFPIIADGDWHDVALDAEKIAGGEHWGGANDGKWNGGIRQMALSVTAGSDEKGKRPEIFLSDVQAEITVPVFAQPAAFGANFDDGKMAGWSAGSIKDGALLLARNLDEITKPCSVTSPEFPASSGQWEIKLRHKTDLYSPDNSYSAVVRVDCLAGDGSLIESLPLADVFGKQEWKEVKVLLDFPKGTAHARLHAQLNKTYGEFHIDDVRAAYLAPMKRGDDRIARLLFSTAQLGNLLYPNDPRKVSVSVETRKALKEHQMQITGVVRDYWGSEHTGEMTVALKNEGDHLYGGEIDLGDAPLEIGRYYELHASIPGSDEQTEAFSNHTSFAILPEAVTRKYKPEQIPFTSRNWDNRINEYIRLTDRLGIRICGLWGGWSDEPPYKPEAPGLELCKELGMGWLSNTPIATIERGDQV
jgi:hypothetical protein